MKRHSFLILFLLSFSVISSQNIFDALRYSQTEIYGTARFNAMGGAFSALGGDMASIGLNPAASSVFLQNQMSFTPVISDRKNSAWYNGTKTNSNDIDFNVSNAGGVFVWNNYNESPWKKFSVGINFNLTNSFENSLAINGRSGNSIGTYFRNIAQGIPLNLLQLQGGESISELYRFLGETEGTAAQDAFLGYQGFIIDPVEDIPENSNYVSNTGSGSYNQGQYTYSDGYMGQYTLNLSTQYGEHLYFGFNLNTHSINYRESSFFTERNSNNNSSIKYVGFENNLYTLGNGFSFQLGTIAKLNDQIRMSFSFDSPTWYTISEETTQYLESTRIVDGSSEYTNVDPRIINIFRSYNFQTPAKLTAGGAYIFGYQGLISFEYSYKDYGTTKFRPSSDPYFSARNNTIQNELKGSSSIKLGGEYRWNQVSFRGGFGFDESPSKNDLAGDRTTYSFGLGYNAGSYTIDFSYSRSQQDQLETLFPETNTAQVSVARNVFLLTTNINL